jgi:hypothetical protein
MYFKDQPLCAISCAPAGGICRRSANEHDRLRKLGGAKLGGDFVYAAVVQQQRSRDHALADAFASKASRK